MRNINRWSRYVFRFWVSPSNAAIKNKQDPYRYRLKLLPALQELTTHKSNNKMTKSSDNFKIQKATER